MTIKANLPAVSTASTKAAPKSLPDTKCPTPQDVAGGLREQADVDMQRANELKALSEQLKNDGVAQAGAGAATVAEGIAGIAQGYSNLHDGKGLQEQGQAQVAAGLDQEKAGQAQEQSGVDSFTAGLAEAKDLNTQSKTISAMTALGIMAEGVYTQQAVEANKTFAQQLEEARGQAGELGAQLADLNTGMAAEGEANNNVIAGNAQFDAGLAQNREGTASLLTGVANQTTAAGKGEKAAQAEKSASTFQIHSETHSALSEGAKDQSIDTSILAGQEFAQATKLENKSNKQQKAGENALSVADLLARVAQIDAEAGQALQPIPGFLAEGNKNIADSELKASDSENRRQDGLTHLSAADSLAAEANVSFGHGVEYAKEAADLAQQSKDLSDQAAAELESANAKQAEADELKAAAAELQATGDAQVAQGKQDRLEGTINAATGLAGMTSGLVAEQQAHNAMNATSANIPGITDRQTANQAARNETLASADKAFDGIEESLDFQAQANQAQADTLAAKQTNLGGRVDSLSEIVGGEKAQSEGFAAQHEGMDNVQAGTDQERQGHEQIATGQNQVAVGKTQVHEGTQKIQKGDQTGQAGAVLETKANKYGELANEVDGGQAKK